MASVENVNGFNNLLFHTKRRIIADRLEHAQGRTPLDLSFKGYPNINNVLTCKASQINGKQGGIIYMPTAKHSRPYYGYDARIDTTILDSVRNKLVNVSGRLMPNRDLRMKYDTNVTQRPLIPIGVIH